MSTMLVISATKGERREAKRHKNRYGHKVDGRSVQTIQRVITDRAQDIVREDTKQAASGAPVLKTNGGRRSKRKPGRGN